MPNNNAKPAIVNEPKPFAQKRTDFSATENRLLTKNQKQSAIDALPKHPIKVDGRFVVTIGTTTDDFVKGRTYTVDTSTKKMLDDKKAILASTPA